ncbi:MAG: hypothetical protein V8Q30_06850 [Acutalibacteraceae bacterium]
MMEYPQSNLMPADFLGQLVSLIRVAKHDTKQLYAGYSESNIERVKYMSGVALRPQPGRAVWRVELPYV